METNYADYILDISLPRYVRINSLKTSMDSVISEFTSLGFIHMNYHEVVLVKLS